MNAADERTRWGLGDSLALGIALGGVTGVDDWKRVVSWAERAEALGLHSLWLPEMHFAPGASSTPLLNLAAFAARTRRLRLGTTSLLLPIHHPLRVAEQVSILDRLSGGRVLLSLGRGFRAPLFAAFGIDSRSKRDRFDAALDLMLDSWAGRPIELAGTPFEDHWDRPPDSGDADSTHELKLLPLQQPHPPLAVAAFGRKGLAQAARRGLPYLASPVESLEGIADNLKFHRNSLPPGFDASGLVVPIMRTVHVAENVDEAARVAGALEAEARNLAGRGRVPKALARAADTSALERAIVGTRDEVIRRVAQCRERLGMDLLIVRPQVSGASRAECEASLARLATDVLPALA